MTDKKETWTGERLEPYITDETMLEHLHRYAIAIDYVKGKKVLDIACGEGYGANLLAKSASQVMAIDIDKPTIASASNKYKNDNLIYQVGSILKLPFEEHSFDIITCFETIEHVEEHELALSELKRVLSPDGILIISTPEKLNYSDSNEEKNIFHKKELYETEFKYLLNNFFNFTSIYKQSSYITSTIIKENLNEIEHFYTGDYSDVKDISTITPIYWIAIASDKNTNELPSSIYYHQQLLKELINEEKALLKKTMTYRVGKFILFPFKKIRKLLHK